MSRYFYDGPVKEFNTCVTNRWVASTYAESESKARTNLAYRFKKENKKLPSTKITLPGKIMMVQ